MTEEHFKELLQEQLSSFTHAPAREWIERRLIEPVKTNLTWDYGSEVFEAWFVGEVAERDVYLAYCEGAHADPWGFVFRDSYNCGMDSQWHANLESLVFSIGGVRRPPGWETP